MCCLQALCRNARVLMFVFDRLSKSRVLGRGSNPTWFPQSFIDGARCCMWSRASWKYSFKVEQNIGKVEHSIQDYKRNYIQGFEISYSRLNIFCSRLSIFRGWKASFLNQNIQVLNINVNFLNINIDVLHTNVTCWINSALACRRTEYIYNNLMHVLKILMSGMLSG